MMLVIGDKLALSFEQSNFTMSNIFTLLGSAILFLGLVKRNCDTYGQKNTRTDISSTTAIRRLRDIPSIRR